ncbi:hypothetical protein F5Y18DRAFT_386964 [Xylariaceae sp. FL1019]|nr:hypothetical protein F5Y18DRAFT_386964 [Xylariaceae sp. FL1019]
MNADRNRRLALRAEMVAAQPDPFINNNPPQPHAQMADVTHAQYLQYQQHHTDQRLRANATGLPGLGDPVPIAGYAFIRQPEEVPNIQHRINPDDVPVDNNPQPKQLVNCVICEDEFDLANLEDFAKLYRSMDCAHFHCKPCLRENAQHALKSIPFRPAKCCKVIPTSELQRFGALSPQEEEEYARKVEELVNPQRGLYCWSDGCGSYIPLDDRKTRIGVCPKCGLKTCMACTGKSHFGPCDKQKLAETKQSDEQLYALAGKKGWKRCPNCSNVVQKNGGCDNMACTCGQNFCYSCGSAVTSYGHNCR